MCDYDLETERYRKCLPCAWVCDQFHDCIDGSDESTITCDVPEGECLSCQYQCTNGRCIDKYYKCNGVDDCGDNSDEGSQAFCPDS